MSSPRTLEPQVLERSWPTWLHWAAPLGLGALVTAVLMIVGAATNDAIAMASFGLGPAVALLTSALLALRSPRTTQVTVSPGLVRVGTGPFAMRIVPADVLGASTARRSDGVSLALSLRSQPTTPLELRFAHEDDARAVMTALGVGHGGTGTLTWQLTPSWLTVLDRILRVVGGLAWLAAGVGLLGSGLGWGDAAPVLGLATLAALASLVAMLVVFVGRAAGAAVLQLDRRGLGFGQSGLPWGRLQWDEIEGATAVAGALRVDTRKGPVFIPLPPRTTEATARHMLAQVLSAAKRAHGLGPGAPDHSQVADLARGAREPVRAWLARIDGLVGQGFGYRGRPLGVVDLWALLEDPDAAPDARAAAARLLARVAPDELRVRIAPVLSAVADDGPRRRIYVASHVTETERAAQELEALEREDEAAWQQAAVR
jgi:hypothetical protein